MSFTIRNRKNQYVSATPTSIIQIPTKGRQHDRAHGVLRVRENWDWSYLLYKDETRHDMT